ncbi:Peptidyl-prolyl cis-trans isomerase FKBP62 [Bienertia sinuspersici]
MCFDLFLPLFRVVVITKRSVLSALQLPAIVPSRNLENEDYDLFGFISYLENPNGVLENSRNLKDEGNISFNFDIALEKYSLSCVFLSYVDLQEEDARSSFSQLASIVVLNMAASFLKKEFEHVGQLCSIVLNYNSNNVKALFRRANATIGLGKHELASWDLRVALEVEQTNQEVKKQEECGPIDPINASMGNERDSKEEEIENFICNDLDDRNMMEVEKSYERDSVMKIDSVGWKSITKEEELSARENEKEVREEGIARKKKSPPGQQGEHIHHKGVADNIIHIAIDKAERSLLREASPPDPKKAKMDQPPQVITRLTDCPSDDTSLDWSPLCSYSLDIGSNSSLFIQSNTTGNRSRRRRKRGLEKGVTKDQRINRRNSTCVLSNHSFQCRSKIEASTKHSVRIPPYSQNPSSLRSAKKRKFVLLQNDNPRADLNVNTPAATPPQNVGTPQNVCTPPQNAGTPLVSQNANTPPGTPIGNTPPVTLVGNNPPTTPPASPSGNNPPASSHSDDGGVGGMGVDLTRNVNLAPTAGSILDLRLALAVDDVNELPNLN